MLIFVAYNGKSLEVAVEPTTRVAAIMETLVGVTGVHVGNQILMSDRIRLDPSTILSTYSLPETDGSKTKDVFLYNKSHLRIGGEVPPAEVAKPLEAEEPVEDEVEEPVSFGGDASPLMRALPQYERQFRWHVKVGQAGLAAARQRHRDCSELVSEMEVQGRAIDSARKSVEVHYTYIHSQLSSFIQQYAVQRKAHGELLAGFEGELEALKGVELHPAASAPGQTQLVHLLNAPKLREWAAECQSCHHSLANKVGDLEEVFGGLRTDVEAVFMQAPTVHLEALATQVDAMTPHLDELASILQVLENDSRHVQRLVAAQAREGWGAAGGGASTLDNCQLMETVNENHTSHLLPQVERFRAMFEHLYQRCVEDKNQMSRDVVRQLQGISSQQMKIQSMRNKLAVFREASAKEEEMFQQLLLVRRVPVAYRQCLAECMRRQAFSEVYAGQARQMAERMGKLRSKECDRRDAFRRQVQAYVPLGLLTGLGLHNQPAHCQISLPSQPPGLPVVSPADLQRLPAVPAAFPGGVPSSAKGGEGPARDSGGDPGEPEAAEPIPSGAALQADVEMENARLRAHVADLLAQECARELQRPLVPALGDPAAPSSPRGGGVGASGGGQGGWGRSEQQAAATLASRLQAAVAAKQEVVAGLERGLATAHHQGRAYEARILELEERLAIQAAEEPTQRVELRQAEPPQPEGSPSPGEAPRAITDGGKSRPMPIPLTPVVMSPTRSASPADLAATDRGEALTTALGISASAAALQASQGQSSSPDVGESHPAAREGAGGSSDSDDGTVKPTGRVEGEPSKEAPIAADELPKEH